MTANTEDTLRKHLDAVDRLERKFKRTTAFALIVALFTYGSFFYLAATHGTDIPLLLSFVVVSTAIGTALAANRLHLSIAHMTNTILKAIELSGRNDQRRDHGEDS